MEAADRPDPIARAADLARAEGFVGAPEELDEAAWTRLLARIDAEAARAPSDWPQDWRARLSAWRTRLRADRADADLAARGEVFAREDDA